MSSFADIDRVIQANLQVFKKPGALTVRPGYKIAHGWISKQQAIVVTVDKKRADISPQDAVPPVVAGYSTDVREATQMQRLRHTNPQLHATIAATARPEHAEPVFPLERDAQTGKPIKTASPPAAVAALAAKPRVAYTPAPGVLLTPITAQMSITCHASPDAGWLELSRFLQGIRGQLTVGMYDFTSAHVLQAVEAGLSGNQMLSLVLDHPALNHTADQSDEQTEAELAAKLKTREQFAWAAEARDPMATQAIFPSAYHIKVAVKDHQVVWHSSGNWNNSNQPEINPFDSTADRAAIDAIAMKSDRDWHVIVQHPGMASVFEAYLKHDLEVALPLQASAAGAKAASLPPAASAPHPEAPIVGTTAPVRYFQPFQITSEKITVQPLLTPDAGAGNYVANILNLINSATTKLYIQTQYIHPPVPGTDTAFQTLIDAVVGQMKKGRDVRIILSEYEATGQWLEKLQEAGLEMAMIRIQNGVHNKGFLVDSKIVALGSQNWSGDGVLRNRDASLIIYHQGAAQYFEGIFIHDWDTLAKQQLSARPPANPHIGVGTS